MSTDPMEFPPFVPAKPRGGVAANDNFKDTQKIPSGSTDLTTGLIKSKRKRRTAAEMEAAGAPKKKKPKQRAASIPLDSLCLLAGLNEAEIDQIVNVCESINSFPKQARKRIAAAIGQLFG